MRDTTRPQSRKARNIVSATDRFGNRSFRQQIVSATDRFGKIWFRQKIVSAELPFGKYPFGNIVVSAKYRLSKMSLQKLRLGPKCTFRKVFFLANVVSANE